MTGFFCGGLVKRPGGMSKRQDMRWLGVNRDKTRVAVLAPCGWI